MPAAINSKMAKTQASHTLAVAAKARTEQGGLVGFAEHLCLLSHIEYYAHKSALAKRLAPLNSTTGARLPKLS
jgi:hypothetical protein